MHVCVCVCVCLSVFWWPFSRSPVQSGVISDIWVSSPCCRWLLLVCLLILSRVEGKGSWLLLFFFFFFLFLVLASLVVGGGGSGS